MRLAICNGRVELMQSLLERGASLDGTDPGLGLTNRQSLEIRTMNEPCHSCHQFINPIGFGLETFDGIGATRTQDKGKDIDASGELPGGQKFANTAELLALLRSNDQFPACITTRRITEIPNRVTNPCQKHILNPSRLNWFDRAKMNPGSRVGA